MNMPIPKIPIGRSIEQSIDFLTLHFSFLTRGISEVIETGIDLLVASMMFFPAWLLILIFSALSWWLAGRKAGILTLLGFLLIWNLGLWAPTISTLALVLIATLIAVMLGLPLGVLAALFSGMHRVTMPVLDFMQTMPAFVYLIPAIPFFGLGPVSAIFSTVIFAMPPAIRLTCL
jgi:glycine betaine/proline transport system permease protein